DDGRDFVSPAGSSVASANLSLAGIRSGAALSGAQQVSEILGRESGRAPALVACRGDGDHRAGPSEICVRRVHVAIQVLWPATIKGRAKECSRTGSVCPFREM